MVTAKTCLNLAQPSLLSIEEIVDKMKKTEGKFLLRESAKNKQIEAFLVANHNKQIKKEGGAKFKQLFAVTIFER